MRASRPRSRVWFMRCSTSGAMRRMNWVAPYLSGGLGLVTLHALVIFLRRRIRHQTQIALKVATLTPAPFRLEVIERHYRSHFFGSSTRNKLVHRNVLALG